jgi:hypothetical protein
MYTSLQVNVEGLAIQELQLSPMVRKQTCLVAAAGAAAHCL